MEEQYVIAGIYGRKGSLENQLSDGLTDVKTDVLKNIINNIDVLTYIKDYEFLEFFRELLYIKFVINKNKKYETE